MLEKKLNLKTILILIIAFAFKIYPATTDDNQDDSQPLASVTRADQPTISKQKNIEKEAILLFLQTSYPSHKNFKIFIEHQPNDAYNDFKIDKLLASFATKEGGSGSFDIAYSKLIPKYITSYFLSKVQESLRFEAAEQNISLIAEAEAKVPAEEIKPDLLGSVEKYQEQYKKNQSDLIEQKLLELKQQEFFFDIKFSGLLFNIKFPELLAKTPIDKSFPENILDYILAQSKLLAEIETAGIHYQKLIIRQKLEPGTISKLVEEKTQINRKKILQTYNSSLAGKITSSTTSRQLLAILKIKKEVLIYEGKQQEAKDLGSHINLLTPSLFKKPDAIEEARKSAISFLIDIPVDDAQNQPNPKKTDVKPIFESVEKTRPEVKYFTDQDKAKILKAYQSTNDKLNTKEDADAKAELLKLQEFGRSLPNFGELLFIREIAQEELMVPKNILKEKEEQEKIFNSKKEELDDEKKQFYENLNILFGGSIYETPDDIYKLTEKASNSSDSFLSSFEKQAKLLAEVSVANKCVESLDNGKSINNETQKLLIKQESERHLKNLLQYYEKILTPLAKAGKSPEHILTILSIQLKQQELLPKSQETKQKQLDLKSKISQLQKTLLSKKESRVAAAQRISESLNYQTQTNNPEAQKVDTSAVDQDNQTQQDITDEEIAQPKTEKDRISELEETLKKVSKNGGSTAFLQGKGHILLDSDGNILVDEDNNKIIISNKDMKEIKKNFGETNMPKKKLDEFNKPKRFKDSDELTTSQTTGDTTGQRKITLGDKFTSINQKPTKVLSEIIIKPAPARK